MPFFTYILRCGDGSFYTGWTDDLDRRIRVHNAGKGGSYTRAHLPVALIYSEAFPSKNEAMSREWAIKKLNRDEKEKLIRSEKN